MQSRNETVSRPSSRQRFLIGGAGTFAGVAAVRAPARAARFAWKWGFPLPSTHSCSIRAIQAFARINKATNGDFAIAAYPDSALGGTTDMVGQVRLGALEMLSIGTPVYDIIAPLSSIEATAFAFPDNPTAFRALDGDVGNVLRATMLPAGLVFLEKPFALGFRNFTNSAHPIRELADVQGLKIRAAPGKLFGDFFKSTGISAVPVNSSDVYTALQTHLIDGQETALAQTEAQKLYEVQKFCSLTRHMWSSISIAINRERWESLPPKYQDLLQKEINASVAEQRRDEAVLERTLLSTLPRQGMAMNNADPATFKARLVSSGYYARWRKEFGESAWAALEKYTGPLG